MTAPSVAAPRRTARRGAVAAVAALLGAALVAWIVTAERMRGMDAGPGTDLGGLGWFLGVWVTMMAAMMLPSAAPMVSAAHGVTVARGGRGAGAASAFVVGYLAAWTAAGLIAYGAFRAIDAGAPGFLAWDREGPLVAGAAVAAAGLYQLTPLKRACLVRCRTPLHWVMHRWRRGLAGSVAMGVEHGAWCIGCCWGLMLALFALGVMSITWMAVVAALVFAEKVLPMGDRIAAAIAVCLIALGAWTALAPASVPALVRPPATEAMPGMPGGGHPHAAMPR